RRSGATSCLMSLCAGSCRRAPSASSSQAHRSRLFRLFKSPKPTPLHFRTRGRRMTKKIEDAKLGDLLPSSIRRDERMRAAAESIQPWLTTIAEAGPDGQLYVDLNTLTSDQLDHLAWQFNADVWRDTWPNNIKRST